MNSPLTNVAPDFSVQSALRPVAAILDDTDVIELAINVPGEAWSLRGKGGWVKHEIAELTETRIRSLITAVIAYRDLPREPISYVELPNGQRGTFILNPACLPRTFGITIRRHMPLTKSLSEWAADGAFDSTKDVSRNVPTEEDIMTRLYRHDAQRLDESDAELLRLKNDQKWEEFLRQCVLRRKNIYIVGKTLSGKTTLARSLIDEVPLEERIVTIEDVHELLIDNHPNRVHMLYGEKGGRVTAKQCLAACMRLSPDRIFLAETRGDEAWEYVMSMGTAHPGSISTGHADSARRGFWRLRDLIKTSGTGRHIDTADIMRVLYTTVDVVVAMFNRAVTEIFFDPIHANEQAG